MNTLFFELGKSLGMLPLLFSSYFINGFCNLYGDDFSCIRFTFISIDINILVGWLL